ncbi:uncharacterized protein PGTG_11021 [Puccinia graminis f. sp. tritici CRL 75-36-700-3]|uniref:Uncharacterized protein n=1 Tax=Puccinia graminis f. sp. tritici (strain CRL 75-36-700-3 / race SCCL) TaxID=418459 RepID=E3KN56_PUCGT|nr:uncharacterized protein PGTG_11021 [Puccinia graminis f. sp. tritici CRL 75-36-700-3]EFP85692.1 hypothetical protein PGTG_11021 [Puccinia graminis f. sp. tritici CRL 75-36-700-3]
MRSPGSYQEDHRDVEPDVYLSGVGGTPVATDVGPSTDIMMLVKRKLLEATMLGSSKIQLCLIARVAAQLTKDDPNGFSMYTHSIIGVIRLSLTAHESRIVLPTLVTFTNKILSSRKRNTTTKSNNSISFKPSCLFWNRIEFELVHVS